MKHLTAIVVAAVVLLAIPGQAIASIPPTFAIIAVDRDDYVTIRTDTFPAGEMLWPCMTELAPVRIQFRQHLRQPTGSGYLHKNPTYAREKNDLVIGSPTCWGRKKRRVADRNRRSS